MSTPLEAMGTPLCFAVDADLDAPAGPGARTQRGRFRSLSTMQKEALLTNRSGTTWRLASDEGPYLDGADVAPPPLAFLSAGVVSSAMAEVQGLTVDAAVDLADVELVLDTYYSISGSALQGTMTGTAHRPPPTAHGGRRTGGR